MKSRAKIPKKEKELKIQERIYELIKQLSKLQSALYFKKPVDVVEFKCPNYYDVIKNPMDLQTMKEKLMKNDYKKIEEVKTDIDLIIQNCHYYNPNPQNLVRKQCIKFEQSYQHRWSQFQQQLIESNYSEELEPISNEGLDILDQKDNYKQEEKLIRLMQESQMSIIKSQEVNIKPREEYHKVYIENEVEQKKKKPKEQIFFDEEEFEIEIEAATTKYVQEKKHDQVKFESTQKQQPSSQNNLLSISFNELRKQASKVDEPIIIKRDPIILNLQDFKQSFDVYSEKKIQKYKVLIPKHLSRIINFIRSNNQKPEFNQIFKLLIEEGQQIMSIVFGQQMGIKQDQEHLNTQDRLIFQQSNEFNGLQDNQNQSYEQGQQKIEKQQSNIHHDQSCDYEQQIKDQDQSYDYDQQTTDQQNIDIQEGHNQSQEFDQQIVEKQNINALQDLDQSYDYDQQIIDKYNSIEVQENYLQKNEQLQQIQQIDDSQQINQDQLIEQLIHINNDLIKLQPKLYENDQNKHDFLVDCEQILDQQMNNQNQILEPPNYNSQQNEQQQKEYQQIKDYNQNSQKQLIFDDNDLNQYNTSMNQQQNDDIKIFKNESIENEQIKIENEEILINNQNEINEQNKQIKLSQIIEQKLDNQQELIEVIKKNEQISTKSIQDTPQQVNEKKCFKRSEINFKSLTEYIQKILIWFRTFQNDEEVFKNQKKQKKFFSTMNYLFQCIIRYIKYNQIQYSHRDSIQKSQINSEFKEMIKEKKQQIQQQIQAQRHEQYGYYDETNISQVSNENGDIIHKRVKTDYSHRNRYNNFQFMDMNRGDHCLVKFKKPLKNLEKMRMEKLRLAMKEASTQQKKDKIFELSQNLNIFVQEQNLQMYKKSHKMNKNVEINQENKIDLENIDQIQQQIENIDFSNFEIQLKQPSKDRINNLKKLNIFNIDTEMDIQEQKSPINQPFDFSQNKVMQFDQPDFTQLFDIKNVKDQIYKYIPENYKISKIFLIDILLVTIFEKLSQQNQVYWKDMQQNLLKKHENNKKLFDFQINDDISNQFTLSPPKFQLQENMGKSFFQTQQLYDQMKKDIKFNQLSKMKIVIIIEKTQILNQNKIDMKISNQINIHHQHEFMNLSQYHHKLEKELIEQGYLMKDQTKLNKFARMKFYESILYQRQRLSKMMKINNIGAYVDFENPKQIDYQENKLKTDQQKQLMSKIMSEIKQISLNIWMVFDQINQIKLNINGFDII